MSDNGSISRMCAVGLLTTDYYDDIENFLIQAEEHGHDFIVTPISHPTFKRVLSNHNTQEHANWKENPAFNRNELIIKSADSSYKILGSLAEWIQLDSSDPEIRSSSEIALKQEVDWARHIGLPSVMLPNLPKGSLFNTARVINGVLNANPNTTICVKVTLVESDNLPWKQWSKLKLLAENNPRLQVILELTSVLPSDEQLLNMWIAEPVKSIIVPGEIFVPNSKGYPVLPKGHQRFIQKIMDKFKPDVIVTVPNSPIHKSATPSSYCDYIRYLNRNLRQLSSTDIISHEYLDVLQNPLQPLMDNLENNTYAVFESDPIKYELYEKAVYKALLDRVEHGSDVVTTIMVVGAGRGPLVNCCLSAAEKSERKVHIYALEKNRNAYVTLQNMSNDVWGDRVTLVFADMRKWNPPTKCDILVSELLGSFGDNELSPECLDGAQKFIKEGGISIPANYTAYAAPMASTSLHNKVDCYKDLQHYETPYVVLFGQVCEIAPSKQLWTFEHPNTKFDKSSNEDPLNNLHNTRYGHIEFDVKNDIVMHGISGYFESVLYKDVIMSIHPDTHSPNMTSWFPIYFPLRSPVQLIKDSTVSLYFWRLTDTRKVWYEWAVAVKGKNGEELSVTPIHNVNGRSYFVGL